MTEITSSIHSGITLLKQGNYPEALELFQDLNHRYPDNPDILYNFGVLLNSLKDYIGAARALERLISIEPGYENAKVALCFSYINMNKIEEAISILEEARGSDPDNLFLLQNLGAAYGKTKQFEKALEVFIKAESLEPASRPIHYAIAQTLCSLHRYPEASRYLKIITDEGIDDQFDELAKDLEREIASTSFSRNGLRLDAVQYCLSALEYFNTLSFTEIQAIAFEIAKVGEQGLDPSDPNPKYTLQSMKGEFTALGLLCYMYVGFQIIKPDVDIGFDLSKEFEMAEKMLGK